MHSKNASYIRGKDTQSVSDNVGGENSTFIVHMLGTHHFYVSHTEIAHVSAIYCVALDVS
jgi:hypothetical protein